MASFPMQTIKVIKCHSTALTLAFPKDLSTIYMGYKVNLGQNTINKFLIKEDSFVGGFDGHSSSLSKMIFYRDFSKVLTDAGDGGLRLWDLDLKIQLKLIDVKLGFRDYSLSFNEKMIAFSAQSKMFVWDIDENKIIFSIDFDDFSIVSVFFICFDKFIVVHTSNILSFILVDTQKIIRRVKYNRIWLTSVLKVNEKLFVQNFGKKIFKVWGVNEEKQNKYVEFNNSSSDIVSGTLSKSKSYLVLTNLVYHCYVLKHH
jgi:WD40 repeat protein